MNLSKDTAAAQRGSYSMTTPTLCVYGICLCVGGFNNSSKARQLCSPTWQFLPLPTSYTTYVNEMRKRDFFVSWDATCRFSIKLAFWFWRGFGKVTPKGEGSGTCWGRKTRKTCQLHNKDEGLACWPTI